MEFYDVSNLNVPTTINEFTKGKEAAISFLPHRFMKIE
jgi:hypothetical protein